MSAGDERVCPMCASGARELHRTVRKGDLEYRIAKCKQCGFVFVANPREETFHGAAQTPSRVPQRARHRQIKRVCDLVFVGRVRSADEPLRVIEVGAGWGGLAQVFARDRRYQYVGLEPSDDRAAFCRSRGFDVRTAVFAGPASAGPADVVVFDNVLEHVHDPLALASAAVATLRPGGVLVIIVPNVADMRQLYPPWRDRHHWQPHSHINYFSARHLRELFARHGLACRYFGLRALGRSRGDLGMLPRIAADRLGVHVLGLNCYAVKPGAG